MKTYIVFNKEYGPWVAIDTYFQKKKLVKHHVRLKNKTKKVNEIENYACGSHVSSTANTTKQKTVKNSC